MSISRELKSPAILDACEADKATCHPTERVLNRYASNQIGPRGKKTVVQHLEGCEDCRKAVTRLHSIARTFRDWERVGIMQAAQPRAR